MSLLTGSRASFRADHHERSEVGGAEAEGLVNDTGTDPARGLRQRHCGRVGGSSAHGEPGTETRRVATGATARRPQEEARPVQNGDRTAASRRGAELCGKFAPGSRKKVERAGLRLAAL